MLARHATPYEVDFFASAIVRSCACSSPTTEPVAVAQIEVVVWASATALPHAWKSGDATICIGERSFARVIDAGHPQNAHGSATVGVTMQEDPRKIGLRTSSETMAGVRCITIGPPPLTPRALSPASATMTSPPPSALRGAFAAAASAGLLPLLLLLSAAEDDDECFPRLPAACSLRL